jgi:hypothetical protein
MFDPKATIARVAYKPGWTFKIAGPLGRFLCVYARTIDSQNHSATRTTLHQFEMPESFDDERDFLRWMRDRLALAERHETCEFLTLDGVAPFYPNHQDEGSPYDLVERWETTCR